MACSVPEAAALPLSLVPRSGESLPGFLVRLAGRSRVHGIGGLVRLAKLRQPGSALERADLSPLARLVGCDPGVLAGMVYVPADRPAHHRFSGGLVHREQIDLRRRRACPACLREADHHRDVWDLSLAGCCPTHALLLVSACGRCSAPLHWQTTSLTRCDRCGADLLSGPEAACTGSEASATQDFQALAIGDPVPWLPASLRDADRSDLMRLSMALGMVASGWEGQRRPECVAGAGPAAAARIVAGGVAVLRDWPTALEEILRCAARDADARGGRFGARRGLGNLYDLLVGLPGGVIRDAVAEVARGVLASDPVTASRLRKSRLLALVAPDGAPLSLKDAARALGTTGQRVKRLASAGALAVSGVEGRGLPAAVDPAAVKALAARRARLVNMRQAAALLAVSRDRLRRLVEHGMLAPVHRATEDRLGSWAFDVRDLAELLRRLEARLAPGGGGETVGFEAAVEAARRRGIGLADFLRLALECDLRPTAIDAGQIGLKRLRFSAREVRALCRATEAAGSALTLQAAAELLGLKWEQVRHLVRVGLLRAKDGGVPVMEVHAFAREFVAASELARERRTSPRAVMGWLRAVGIRPVTGPGVDGGRKAFFRRADLPGRACA